MRANREVALLSNLIGLAIDRGEAKHNPCREVRRNEEQPRTEAPEPEDFQAFAAWVASLGGQKAVIGMAAEYAALAGNRKVEFLDLSWPQVDEVAGVIRVKRAKQRGRKRGEVIEHIEITPALSELITRLRTARKDDCLYVFSNRYATHYSPAGFKTEWSNLMKGVGTEEDREALHVPRPARVLRDPAQGGTWCAAGSARESGNNGARLRSDEDREAERFVIPNLGITKQKRHCLSEQCRF
uniref:hypothetical protein n=1 Tax=Burkholderia diffusa TaxID=488732 RepID=UPI001CC5A34B|nr:hypothetical protein [Burkholderia diffusa]